MRPRVQSRHRCRGKSQTRACTLVPDPSTSQGNCNAIPFTLHILSCVCVCSRPRVFSDYAMCVTPQGDGGQASLGLWSRDLCRSSGTSHPWHCCIPRALAGAPDSEGSRIAVRRTTTVISSWHTFAVSHQLLVTASYGGVAPTGTSRLIGRLDPHPPSSEARRRSSCRPRAGSRRV